MAGDEGKLAFFKYTVTAFQRDRVSSFAPSFLGKRFADVVGVFRPATFAATCATSSALIIFRNLRPLCSCHRQLQHFVFRKDTRILIPELAVLIYAHANDGGRHKLQKTKCALGRNSAERDEFAWCGRALRQSPRPPRLQWQVDIAQEGSHQCSNTENSDSDSLTKTSQVSNIAMCEATILMTRRKYLKPVSTYLLHPCT